MNITGTLVYYFIHCSRQCWLFYNNIHQEHTSEEVKIGKILHQLKYNEIKEFEEVEFLQQGIKLDKINFKKNGGIEIEEFKKSGKELRGQFFQVLYYLYVFEKYGINAIGKLIFDEKHKIDENQLQGLDYKIEGFKIYIYLTENNKKQLDNILKSLQNLLLSKLPPAKLTNKSGGPNKKCRGCSYFYFCWI